MYSKRSLHLETCSQRILLMQNMEFTEGGELVNSLDLDAQQIHKEMQTCNNLLNICQTMYHMDTLW